MRQITATVLAAQPTTTSTARLQQILFAALAPGQESVVAARSALTLLGSSRELSLCASVVTLPATTSYGRVTDADDQLALEGRLVTSCLAALRGVAPQLLCDAVQRSLNSDSPPQRVSAACALLVLLVSWRV
jgi:hypothetical protein